MTYFRLVKETLVRIRTFTLGFVHIEDRFSCLRSKTPVVLAPFAPSEYSDPSTPTGPVIERKRKWVYVYREKTPREMTMPRPELHAQLTGFDLSDLAPKKTDVCISYHDSPHIRNLNFHKYRLKVGSPSFLRQRSPQIMRATRGKKETKRAVAKVNQAQK
jgi:hypothetical protein